MNTKQITAAIVLFAAAGAAMAESPFPPETKFVSTKTRAEVISELQQAQAQGLITNGNNYPIVIQARSPCHAAKSSAKRSPPATTASTPVHNLN